MASLLRGLRPGRGGGTSLNPEKKSVMEKRIFEPSKGNPNAKRCAVEKVRKQGMSGVKWQIAYRGGRWMEQKPPGTI